MISAFGVDHGLIAKYQASGYSGAFGSNRRAVREANRPSLKLVKQPDTSVKIRRKKQKKAVA